ncbi:MAG: FkbM family methyltransferase [Deltaproteobacteria bacterium]|nr:FkbM family methyltransferase [Deltaproteobacteria bacterium]
MTERDRMRAKVRATAAELKSDPYRYFPEWYRRTRPSDLSKRPIFLAGPWGGWGDARARAARGEIDVRGVTEWIPEFLLASVLWRLAPKLRKLPAMIRPGPAAYAAIERLVLKGLGIGAALRGGAPPILSVDDWVHRAKATPGSLSLIPEESEHARKFERIARENGLDALYLTEAMRLPEFASWNRGPYNDALGDTAARIEEFLALEDVFADDESVQVLHRTLLYKMTHHHVELEPIVQAGCRKYFPAELLHLRSDERFIDVGGFIGDSIQQFFNVTGGRFRQVISLEPDDHNYLFLEKYRASLSAEDAARVVCLKVGAWNEKTRLTFHATGTGGSNIDATNTAANVGSIDVTTLDALADEYGPPTLIKCEAEGSDREALIGCARTMATHRPRMAITVYHLWDDYLALVPLVRGPNPDYKLALRHYSLDHSGTTMYAY